MTRGPATADAASLTALLRSTRGALAAASIAVIVVGLLLRLSAPSVASAVWLAGLVITGAPIVWRTVLEARHGRWATDVVAVLAIVGAVALQQPLAGLVIVLMRSGGEALEQYAAGRASAALRELEAAAPRIAHRLRGKNLTSIDDISVALIQVGDLLLVRPGELVPCDAVVRDGNSQVDVARLTGEPVPLAAAPGSALMSGSVNGDGVLTIAANARAEDSQYARIVELVRTAQTTRAPLVRLADRYAIWFTPVTILVCLVTYLVTRDATRVLSVLVVATPCPLILATPIAIIGGISRAARKQIIVAAATGGRGRARLESSTCSDPRRRRAGGQERRRRRAGRRARAHRIARSGRDRRRRGARGFRRRARFHSRARPFDARGIVACRTGEVGLRANVAIDGRLAGVVEYSDRTRPGVRDLLGRLASLGVRRSLLLSGDHAANVRAVAQEVGIHEARGDLLPEGKVSVVHQLVREGAHELMVGDGTNDAPALSAAQVGVALASHGGGISAEAADVVVLTDDLSRVADAVEIGHRTLNVARQSIWLGLGLSVAAMIGAAFGSIPPTVGALLQEVIDIASITNALRASRG